MYDDIIAYLRLLLMCMSVPWDCILLAAPILGPALPVLQYIVFPLIFAFIRLVGTLMKKKGGCAINNFWS